MTRDRAAAHVIVITFLGVWVVIPALVMIAIHVNPQWVFLAGSICLLNGTAAGLSRQLRGLPPGIAPHVWFLAGGAFLMLGTLTNIIIGWN